jgi:acyl carrier protein/NADP-dependent 3-hydroxy acid dehydrogenase YdfG
VKLRARRPVVVADLTWYDDDGRPLGSIDGLALAVVDADALSPAVGRDAWVHDMVWRLLAAGATASAPGQASRTMVVASGDEAADKIADELRRAGCALIASASDGDGGEAPWKHRLERAAGLPVDRRQALVYVWPGGQGDEPAGSEPAACAAYQCFSSFWQTMQSMDWPGGKPALCVLTCRGQQTGVGDARGPDPAQAMAWGLARSLMHESGDQRVVVVDVAESDVDTIAIALSGLGHALASEESQFAVRDRALWVPRMVRRPSSATGTGMAAMPVAVAGGAYLVTGGRGAIGLQLTEWLLARGASKVVSLSRGRPADNDVLRLALLAQGSGTILEFVSADIADEAAVHALVRDLALDAACPLKGVLHAAGTLDDGLLARQPMDAARQVLAPKVAGAHHLHRATFDVALDFFVSFSSVVSCIGSPGQCAYGAANAYLDALSLARNAQGLPGHVVNWGLWDGQGMASRLDDRQRQRVHASGILPMAPVEALRILDRLVAEPCGQSVVWNADIDTLAARSLSPGLRPLLGELTRLADASGDRPAPGMSLSIAPQLLGLSATQQHDMLSTHLLNALSRTLQADAGRIDPLSPLIELGLDSLMAAEFRAAIRQGLGVDIPFGRLLEGATLHDVVDTIVAKLAHPPVDTDIGQAPPAGATSLNAVSGEALFGAELESGQL